MTLQRKLYFTFLVLIVAATLAGLIYKGGSFYNVGIEDRFYHQDYKILKPSGSLGHGYGIVGSVLMVSGVLLYFIRKRYRIFYRMGLLKHWLEFHIFLCTLGPLLILFHTSFKFGGLVAISFWSMVAVFLSGIIGRFIYLQIPRSIEGRELSLNEVRQMKTDVTSVVGNIRQMDAETVALIESSTRKKVEVLKGNFMSNYISGILKDRNTITNIKVQLRKKGLNKPDAQKIINLVKNDLSLNRKIDRLNTMQNLFKYWHVAHLPFAIVMIIIMIIHVAVTIIFGYRWIF